MERHQALLSFCRVVETGGFAAAARDLDLSPSMVTKTIQQLEAWTGSRLLARTTRRMQLTEAGEQFYAYCRRVIEDTERTLGAIRAATGQPAGRLVLAVPVSLTLSYLKEHLHAFQAAHPAIELELRLSDRPVDLVRDGVDLALRGQAQLEDSSLVAVPLMTLERAVAASPAYWRHHGKPAAPLDLSAHNCLVYLLGSDATSWQFDGPDGPRTVEVRGSLRADSSLLLIDAMLRGVGVGLVPRVMMQAELAEGRLLTALEAGLAAGGEAGPIHSAGLLVADSADWPTTNLRVDWSEAPIADLRVLWDVWAPQKADYVTRALDPTSAPSYGVPGDE